MRNRLLPLGFAAGCVLLASPELDACDDKFLRMGRALRMSRAAHLRRFSSTCSRTLSSQQQPRTLGCPRP